MEYLSKQQCGFKNSYSKQLHFLVMFEKWIAATDMGKCFKALSTNLSKQFACFPHYLLLAKSHDYGFNKN